MLDANLILNDVEQLLDSHYARLVGRAPSRVQVYDTPPKVAAVEQALPVVPTAKPAAVNDLVASVFVLLVLSLLNNKLAPKAMRK